MKYDLKPFSSPDFIVLRFGNMGTGLEEYCEIIKQPQTHWLCHSGLLNQSRWDGGGQ